MTIYPTVVSTTDLKININLLKCDVTTATVPSIENKEYNIGDAGLFVPFTAFQSAKADSCNYSWTYSAALAALPSDNAPMIDYI